MKQKAIETRLIVRPLVGCLIHTHFWEGPCRAGNPADMTSEKENEAADRTFAAAKETLKKATDKISFLPAIDVRYTENFVVPEETFSKIEENLFFFFFKMEKS